MRVLKSARERMESLSPAQCELDTTLTPSVTARSLEVTTQAAHISLLKVY